MISRLVFPLYCLSLFLLPWAWFPPFPWLHHHAQWSDALFALTALLWGIDKFRTRRWPRWEPFYFSLGLYLAAALFSLLAASPNKTLGAMKLLGLVELCLLAVITSDLAVRPAAMRVISLTVLATTLLAAFAALLGLGLFYAGIPTELIGTYGDLEASRWYARVQAGTYQPNLLASFLIFAAAVIARGEAALPKWLRRATTVAMWGLMLLTFSRALLGFSVAALLRAAKTPMQRKLVVGCAVVCVAIIASLTMGNLSFDPSQPRAAHFNHTTASSRWQAMTTSWATLVAHPLTGCGVGQPPGRYRGGPFDAHCTPLNVAATMGLPALVAFASLFVLLWRKRGRAMDIALWSGMAGLALDALAQDIEDYRHLWVLIGLTAASLVAPTDASTQATDKLVEMDACSESPTR